MRNMRPVLNRWLGGFGDALSSSQEEMMPQSVSRIDDLTEEWRSRLDTNDLVMHRTRFIDRPRAPWTSCLFMRWIECAAIHDMYTTY